MVIMELNEKGTQRYETFETSASQESMELGLDKLTDCQFDRLMSTAALSAPAIVAVPPEAPKQPANVVVPKDVEAKAMEVPPQPAKPEDNAAPAETQKL